MTKRDTIYAVGNQIGVGKESDIYVVADKEGTNLCLKLHRSVDPLLPPPQPLKKIWELTK